MPDSLAPRTLLGVLVPVFNSVVEPELAGLRPPGVTNQTARFVMDANVLENVHEAGTSLLTCGVRGLLIALSTESIPGGLAVLEQGATRLADDTGLPVHTASHATLAALEALDARTVSVLTPFDDVANGHVRAAFESAGFEVAGLHGLACPSLDRIGHVPEADVLAGFGKADDPRSDALVQVGTGLAALRSLPALEAQHGKPVVAANAALYWQALREAGIDDAIPALGRLGHHPGARAIKEPR